MRTFGTGIFAAALMTVTALLPAGSAAAQDASAPVGGAIVNVGVFVRAKELKQVISVVHKEHPLRSVFIDSSP